MGWKKLGDADDKEQKLCRLLDFVVKGVETLKVAVLHGNSAMGDGDDGTGFDWTQMWCPDILWMSGNTISNIEDAQRTLRRMKEMKTVMSSLSTSLDVAIKTVSDVVIQDSQETGLTRLPDDILAQIFELYHLRTVLEGTNDPPESPEILSLVCKRFYRIAVHLPLLWKNITPLHTDHALSIYQSRCQLIKVDVDLEEENLDWFLGLIRSHDQWEALRLRFRSARIGHIFFERFNPPTQTRFNALRYLAIVNEGDAGGIDLDDWELEDAFRTILEADERTLASWHCPNLTHIKMGNVIPSSFFPCSNVTVFELRLDSRDSNFSRWDLRVLRDFLQPMSNLESLELDFEGEATFDNAVVQHLALPRLRSLGMDLSGFTRTLHIGQFLDILVTESLTKLCLVISIDPYILHNRQVTNVFGFPPATTLLREDPNLWLRAVFRRPASTCDSIRSFPGVTDFDLNIHTQWSSYWIHPAFDPMFAALPNVQDLRLKSPDFFEIKLSDWMENFGGLRKLRSMRLDEYKQCMPHGYSEFFRKLSKMDQWKNFEELNIVRSSSGSFYQENFEECVGNKLVWIGPPV